MLVVFTRRGIESEFFGVTKDAPYRWYDLRNNVAFATQLAALGGEWEYAWNQFELRTLPEEEYDISKAEQGLQNRLATLQELVPDALLLSGGTYQGTDEPRLDLGVSVKAPNVFWSEFNLVFPADVSTRYTAADQLNLSGKDLVDTYNQMVGLAPLLIYAFSTSPTINGVAVPQWNRRQAIVYSKGWRSGTVLPGSYPLRSLDQYMGCLENQRERIAKALTERNPSFFGTNPRKTVSEYRGSLWGFDKLATDQVVRINRGTDDWFVETRCIDAQECVRATAALSALADIGEVPLPTTEREIKENCYQAMFYGDQAIFEVDGQQIPVQQYARQLADAIPAATEYDLLFRDRLVDPPARMMRELVLQGEDMVVLLARCLAENKLIREVEL
ncbi:MAG: hypothetical protein QGG83_02440 [Candidatus Woesearchaeota archaeon]|nr:hypothetical protein [Candidatus Woesearchaeota archaeon]